jgi:hypothetical protein
MARGIVVTEWRPGVGRVVVDAVGGCDQTQTPVDTASSILLHVAIWE